MKQQGSLGNSSRGWKVLAYEYDNGKSEAQGRYNKNGDMLMDITVNVFLTSRYFSFFAFGKPIFYHLKDEQAVHGDGSMKQ